MRRILDVEPIQPAPAFCLGRSHLGVLVPAPVEDFPHSVGIARPGDLRHRGRHEAAPLGLPELYGNSLYMT